MLLIEYFIYYILNGFWLLLPVNTKIVKNIQLIQLKGINYKLQSDSCLHI